MQVKTLRNWTRSEECKGDTMKTLHLRGYNFELPEPMTDDTVLSRFADYRDRNSIRLPMWISTYRGFICALIHDGTYQVYASYVNKFNGSIDFVWVDSLTERYSDDENAVDYFYQNVDRVIRETESAVGS